MSIHITEAPEPGKTGQRVPSTIRAMVDKLLQEPIQQNKLLQAFNYYERAIAGRYLQDLIEQGVVVASGRGVRNDPFIVAKA